MTNAKSRLVRIIALALAVLMIVPMALVGCGKSDVDQAAIDAAIKEALDAAQKAQDAADKAAQDAKDAQDKLAEAEKEADKLQAEIDAMKNTTAAPAPATTTEAPKEDTTVVDAYIASILLNDESDFMKLAAAYRAVKGIYEGDDQDAIENAINTATIAIQRATTVDYANQLVAALSAQLDAIPTYSERVKEAYDKIDFTSNVDIVDVVYAYALLQKAEFAVDKTGLDEDVQKAFDAEKAALVEFGADKLELAKAIETEYARYTGKGDGIDFVDADEVLYNEVYDAAAGVAAKVEELFSSTAPGTKLDVKAIVYDANLAKALKDIEKAYEDVYKVYSKEAYASEKEAFEIAFIGEAYVLDFEGNYLRTQLAAANARAAELFAAYEEYKTTIQTKSTTKGLKVLADEFKTSEFKFTEKKITSINEYAGLLATWMTKYGFDSEDANLNEIMGAGVYADFAKLVAVKDLFVEWNAKLTAISADDIEDAIALIVDRDGNVVENKLFDYAAQSAAVKALNVWYNGTFDKNGVSNEDGVKDAATKDGDKLTAYIAYMITEHIEIDDEDIDAMIDALVAVVNKFEGDTGILADIKKIEKDAKELDPTELTVQKYLNAVVDIKDRIVSLALDTFGIAIDEDAAYDFSVDGVNYDLVPFEIIDTLDAEVAKLVGNIYAEAAKIVEAYIGWKGAAVEEGIAFGGNVYDVEPVKVDIFSYDLITKLDGIYNVINAYEFKGNFELEDVEGDEVTFTTQQVVTYYQEFRNEFYTKILKNFDAFVEQTVSMSTFVNAAPGAANEWMDFGAVATTKLTEYETNYGKFGVKFNYPVDASKITTDGSKINVYKTSANGPATRTYIKAIEDVDPASYVTEKNSSGAATKFNLEGYKAAVEAKINAYRTFWYLSGTNSFLKSTATTSKIETLTQNVINNVIKYGLWTVEGSFALNEDAFTFVVNKDLSVTVLDSDKEIVDGSKFTNVKIGNETIEEVVISTVFDGVKLVVVGKYKRQR